MVEWIESFAAGTGGVNKKVSGASSTKSQFFVREKFLHNARNLVTLYERCKVLKKLLDDKYVCLLHRESMSGGTVIDETSCLKYATVDRSPQLEKLLHYNMLIREMEREDRTAIIACIFKALGDKMDLFSGGADGIQQELNIVDRATNRPNAIALRDIIANGRMGYFAIVSAVLMNTVQTAGSPDLPGHLQSPQHHKLISFESISLIMDEVMDSADCLPADFARLENFTNGSFEKLLLLFYHLCDSENFLQSIEFVHTNSDQFEAAAEKGVAKDAVVKKDGVTGTKSKMAPFLRQGDELGELTNAFFKNSYSVEIHGKKMPIDYDMHSALIHLAQSKSSVDNEL